MAGANCAEEIGGRLHTRIDICFESMSTSGPWISVFVPKSDRLPIGGVQFQGQVVDVGIVCRRVDGVDYPRNEFDGVVIVTPTEVVGYRIDDN